MKTSKFALLVLIAAISPAIQAQTIARPTEEQLRDANRHGEVLRGMNAEEVRKSLGAPDAVNESNVGGAKTEQWVYRNRNNKRLYLYFRGGLLSSWQTLDAR